MKKINEAQIRDAVGVIVNNDILFLMEGDIVNIRTDETDFDKEYLNVEIEVTPDEIWVDSTEYKVNIPYEYITEIELVSRSLE